MGYIEDFQAELSKMLQDGAEIEAVVKRVSDKLVESYRNGLVDGKKKVETKGESRRFQARSSRA